MSHPDEQPIAKLKIGDVASLLGVTVGELPGNTPQRDSLVELIEELKEMNGEEWILQHSGVILDQWERMLTLGV